MTFADIIANYADLNHGSLINSQYLHSISSEIQFRETYALIKEQMMIWVLSKSFSFPFSEKPFDW